MSENSELIEVPKTEYEVLKRLAECYKAVCVIKNAERNLERLEREIQEIQNDRKTRIQDI
jgi:dihydrodipicolinate synthase/N-acetylneuraminate lyase